MAGAGRDIAAAELEVLGALWRLGSGTVRDVLEELKRQGRRLAYTTVLTLLARLEKKGYVRTNKDSHAHVYRPRISRERVAADRLSTMVHLLGDGQAKPLILQLVAANKLSPDDLRQLRELLARLETEAREERAQT